MNSTKQLLAGIKPAVRPATLKTIAAALGAPAPISLKAMMAARSVEVSFRSYTTPKFWDDDPHGNLSSPDLEMVMTQDRQVGNRFWSRGCLYTPTKARNTVEASKSQLERWRDEAVELWDGVIVEYYERAKDTVVGGIADLVNAGFPGACQGGCRAYLKQALEVAMVAVGLPPELPTTRQLISAGASYVAAQMVNTAAPGVLKGITDLGGEQARKYAETLEPQARNAARAEIQGQLESGATNLLLPAPVNPTDNPFTWGIPNPLYQARPAVLFVDLRPKPGSDPRMAEGTWTVQPDAVFAPTNIPISYMPPEGVTVPVVLWPSIGQFVRAAEAEQKGLDFHSWYSQAFGDVVQQHTAPYESFGPGQGVPLYGGAGSLSFTVRNPRKVTALKQSVFIGGEHNINPPTELREPVYGEVFTLRAPVCP